MACQPVDDDLCINVNTLMLASPQVKDIDVEHNYYSKTQAYGACHVCSTIVHNKDDLMEHMKKIHPGKRIYLFIYFIVCLFFCLFFNLITLQGTINKPFK